MESGIYASGGKPSAEIIMVIAPSSEGIDATEDAKLYEKLGLKPNFDFQKMTTAFYSTINGLPTHRFSPRVEKGYS
jgi:hypothetical protein